MDIPSPGTVTAACLAALVLGLLQPFGAMFSMVFVAGTILAAVFWAWAGYVPVILYAGASFASMKYFFGSEAAMAMAALTLLPAAAVVIAIIRRRPFSQRVGAGVLGQFLAFVLLIAVLYAILRQDLATVMVEGLSAAVKQMSGSVRISFLQRFALFGLFDDALSAQIISGTLSEADQIEALSQMYARFGDALRLALPALLVMSGMITGVLAAYFPSRILASRGEDEGYVPLDKWFVPHTVIYGTLTALIAALIMYAMRLNGAEAVLGAARSGGACLTVIAGAAALDRHMKMAGRGRGMRGLLVVGGVLLANTALGVIGAISMALGQKGVISEYVRKKRDHDKGDDDL